MPTAAAKATPPDATPPDAKAPRRAWVALAVLALPCVVYSMDLTVLNLALPRLSADLHPTGAQLLWIVDIYGFLVAGSLVTMGSLGDRIGRRRLLLIGAASFGVASAAAAFSTSAGMLIAARGLLGLAGATLAPSTLSLIRSLFRDDRERTFAIGVWVTGFSVGGAIGPLVGGVALKFFWWGSVFLTGVPVMLLLLAVGPLLLPEHKDPHPGPLDLVSAGLSLASVLPVVYGLKQIAEGGAGWQGAAAIAVGLGFGAAFVKRQRALEHPLIDLRLFRDPAFDGALASYTLGTFVAFGCYVFLGQYLQAVLGLTALRAGLCTVPSMLAFVAGSLIVPALVRRARPAILLSGGFSIATAGFALLAVGAATGHLGLVVAATVVYSLGLSPVTVLATDLIVGSAPVERAGAASAISETSSELGGALGIALLGSLGVAVYRAAMAAELPAGLPADAAEAAKATLGGAVAAAGRLGPQGGHALLSAARAAYVRSFAVAAGSSAILCLAMAALAWALLRHRPAAGAAQPSGDAGHGSAAIEASNQRSPS